MDTFDLLLIFHENSNSTLGHLTDLLPVKEWSWFTLSDAPATQSGHERMVLVRITPTSPDAREAIASRLVAVQPDPHNPLVWWRRNKAEEEQDPRELVADMLTQFMGEPHKLNAGSLVDALTAAVMREVDKHIADAMEDHEYSAWHGKSPRTNSVQSKE